MFKKIVPVVIVALTAVTVVGTAFAHDVTVPRQGFDTALASVQSDSSIQTQSVSNAQAQVRSNSQSVNNASSLNPYAPYPSKDATWWKDR